MIEKTYCAAPWRGLHINPRGDVKTCCAGDPNMLGNLHDHDILEILHGETLREIRSTISNGQLHAEYCYNCIQAERYGRSERHWHNDVNSDFDATTAGPEEHRPVIVDVRWNTTCNLSCNYCGDKCSSRWAVLKNMSFKSGARPYFDAVCDYIEQHRHSVREVALVGGEPLLLPENERLLKVIPEDCIVTLITNASVDLGHNKIFEALSQRHQVGWSLSFENVGDKFEYVRHGAKWPTLLRNLDLIQELMTKQNHWGGIHAVYNVYTVTCVSEITEFARQRGLSINWQTLYQPDYLDPARLGPEIASQARHHVAEVLAGTLAMEQERAFFSSVVDNLKCTDDLTQQFKSHIHDIETRWHPDQHGQFAKLWPELAQVCWP